uniref:Uncharacterized protein n=1 Tax=Mastacembelus armatus TaxID=205130 RepID=A0A3Q3LV03_9TELE
VRKVVFTKHSPTELKAVFLKSINKNDQYFMSCHCTTSGIVSSMPKQTSEMLAEATKLLAGVVDQEFIVFESVLCGPDPLFMVAFLLFDKAVITCIDDVVLVAIKRSAVFLHLPKVNEYPNACEL